jgi:hypothetical protein
VKTRKLIAALLLASLSAFHPGVASDKAKKDQGCKATFKVEWSEGGSDGMNAPQLEWWDKRGKKKFAGLCYDMDNPGTAAEWTIQLQTFRGESSGVGGTGNVVVGSGGSHTKVYYVLYHEGKREAAGSDNSAWEWSEEATYPAVLEKALMEIGKRLEKSGRDKK